MITLDRLVNVLGGSGARLLCCPRSREVLLRSVVVHDPTDSRVATGDVFLAVGVGSAAEAVRLAARVHAVAVLVRGAAPLEEDAVSAAEAAGVPVVLVDPAVSWSQLSGLAYGLVLEGRETESGRYPVRKRSNSSVRALSLGGQSTCCNAWQRSTRETTSPICRPLPPTGSLRRTTDSTPRRT